MFHFHSTFGDIHDHETTSVTKDGRQVCGSAKVELEDFGDTRGHHVMMTTSVTKDDRQVCGSVKVELEDFQNGSSISIPISSISGLRHHASCRCPEWSFSMCDAS